MTKFLNWVAGIFVFVTAVFFASKARSLQQKVESNTEKEVAELSKEKNQNLAKADKLGKKAKADFHKAKQAKEIAEGLAKKLEDNNATNLADRVRSFNDRL